MDNVCLVAVSIYGHDNRSIIEALQSLDADCRAVVSLDPGVVTEQELEDMHTVGVRGVRINLKTKAETPCAEALITRLISCAARIKSRNWIIQLYLGLGQVPLVAHAIPQLGVRVVLDHMASPSTAMPACSQPGYKELLNLLRKGQAWVKISGSYRFADLPDLAFFARSLIKAGPNNVVWASDWPHTGGPIVPMNGRMVSSYREVDDKEFVARCFEWCDHDDKLIRNLFVDNPRRLWLSG